MRSKITVYKTILGLFVILPACASCPPDPHVPVVVYGKDAIPGITIQPDIKQDYNVLYVKKGTQTLNRVNAGETHPIISRCIYMSPEKCGSSSPTECMRGHAYIYIDSTPGFYSCPAPYEELLNTEF